MRDTKQQLGGFGSALPPYRRAKVIGVLMQQVRHKGSVKTRKGVVDGMIAAGAKVVVYEVSDFAKKKKLQKELSNLRRQWYPSGNENHPKTIRAHEIMAILKNDGCPKKEERRLELPDGAYQNEAGITKTAMDYAQYITGKHF